MEMFQLHVETKVSVSKLLYPQYGELVRTFKYKEINGENHLGNVYIRKGNWYFCEKLIKFTAIPRIRSLVIKIKKQFQNETNLCSHCVQ